MQAHKCARESTLSLRHFSATVQSPKLETRGWSSLLREMYYLKSRYGESRPTARSQYYWSRPRYSSPRWHKGDGLGIACLAKLSIIAHDIRIKHDIYILQEWVFYGICFRDTRNLTVYSKKCKANHNSILKICYNTRHPREVGAPRPCLWRRGPYSELFVILWLDVIFRKSGVYLG